jgi:hypothetical protein
MIMKDWKKKEAQRKKADGYPQSQVMTMEIPFDENIEGRMKIWIAEAEACKDLPDDQLPECTMEERWGKPPTFAVKKNGRKTALRVLPDRKTAEKWMESNGGDFIEERMGEQWTRCEYCNAKEFCCQWKRGNPND